jgi:hypothetical protein
MSVSEGSECTFSVIAEGSPSPNIEWFVLIYKSQVALFIIDIQIVKVQK